MADIDITEGIDAVKEQITYAIYGLALILSHEEEVFNNMNEELQGDAAGLELARHIDVVELAIGRLQDVYSDLTKYHIKNGSNQM